MSIIYGVLERLETESVPGHAHPPPAPTAASHTRYIVAVAFGMFAVLSVVGYAGWQYVRTIAAGHAQIPPVVIVEEVPEHRTVQDEGGKQAVAAIEPVELDVPDASPASLEPEETAEIAAQESLVPVEIAKQEAVVPAVETQVVPDREVALAEPVQAITQAEEAIPVEPVVDLQPQVDPIDTAVDQARKALSLGNYSQALAGLESLVDVPEDRADYWLVKGSAHLALGMLESAERCLISAGSVAPGNPQVAVQLAIVNQEKNDHPAALRILTEAAAENAHVPEIFLNMGYSQLAIGAETEAQRSFRTFMNLTRDRSRYQQQREALERWLRQASVATR